MVNYKEWPYWTRSIDWSYALDLLESSGSQLQGMALLDKKHWLVICIAPSGVFWWSATRNGPTGQEALAGHMHWTIWSLLVVNYKEWPYRTRSIGWSYALHHLESSGGQLQGMALQDKKHWLVICIAPSGVFWWSATRNGPTGQEALTGHMHWTIWSLLVVNYKEWPYWTRSIDWSYALDLLESSGSQLQGMALLDKKHWLVICIAPSGVFWWSATRNGPTGQEALAGHMHWTIWSLLVVNYKEWPYRTRSIGWSYALHHLESSGGQLQGMALQDKKHWLVICIAPSGVFWWSATRNGPTGQEALAGHMHWTIWSLLVVNYKEWPYWTRSIGWSYALDHLESSGGQLQGMALLDKKHWLVICIGPSGVFWWSTTRNGPTGQEALTGHMHWTFWSLLVVNYKEWPYWTRNIGWSYALDHLESSGGQLQGMALLDKKH